MSIEERDAIANRRVSLHRVIASRLGMPDRIDVRDPEGRTLACIIATEGALEIHPVAGSFVAVRPGGLAAPLRVIFSVP